MSRRVVLRKLSIMIFNTIFLCFRNYVYYVFLLIMVKMEKSENSQDGIKIGLPDFFRCGAKFVLKKAQTCNFEAKCAKYRVV